MVGVVLSLENAVSAEVRVTLAFVAVVAVSAMVANDV